MAISCNFALQGLWRHICARRHQLRGSLSFAIQWNSHFCLLPRGFGVVTFQLGFHNLFSQLGLCHFCWTLDYLTILLTGQHGSRASSHLDAATLWTRRLFGSYADSIRLHQAAGWELELFRWWLGRWHQMEIFWRISEVRLLTDCTRAFLKHVLEHCWMNAGPLAPGYTGVVDGCCDFDSICMPRFDGSSHVNLEFDTGNSKKVDLSNGIAYVNLGKADAQWLLSHWSLCYAFSRCLWICAGPWCIANPLRSEDKTWLDMNVVGSSARRLVGSSCAEDLNDCPTVPLGFSCSIRLGSFAIT